MRTSRRTALLAYSTVPPLIGVAAMLALVYSFHREPDAAVSAPEPVAAVPTPAPADRLAFLPRGTLPEHALEPALRPSIGLGLAGGDTDAVAAASRHDAAPHEEPGTSDGAASWSTETHQETLKQPATRFTLLPSLRLPWQTPRSGAPARRYTLKERLAELSPSVKLRLAAKFGAAKAVWPPAEVAFVAIKDERALELHARSPGSGWKLVHTYRVLAASGGAGPKLKQGDRQVPEGVYGIALLNPNSAYHVSMRVNYPNAFDRQMAAKDGRGDLGGDIMIHGKNLSAGCLAMGDEAAEELFVLSAEVGLPKVRIVIAPTDLRRHGPPDAVPGRPEWVPKLYADIATAMAEFKPPPSKGLLSFFVK